MLALEILKCLSGSRTNSKQGRAPNSSSIHLLKAQQYPKREATSAEGIARRIIMDIRVPARHSMLCLHAEHGRGLSFHDEGARTKHCKQTL